VENLFNFLLEKVRGAAIRKINCEVLELWLSPLQSWKTLLRWPGRVDLWGLIFLVSSCVVWCS